MTGMEELHHMVLFRDLTDAEFAQLAKLVIVHPCARGEYIFMEGQAREFVYFVKRGLVKIFKVDAEGRENIVNILGAKAMFPHAGLFDDSPYPGTAEALVDGVLYAISIYKFEELLQQHPDMMRKMLRVLGHMILRLQTKLQEVSVFDAKERVGALLWHLVDEHGRAGADGIHLSLPITHTEMARMIALSRESVNRTWNEFRREGIIEGDKDDWIVSREWFDRFRR